jgi:hypothetical protein
LLGSQNAGTLDFAGATTGLDRGFGSQLFTQWTADIAFAIDSVF